VRHPCFLQIGPQHATPLLNVSSEFLGLIWGSVAGVNENLGILFMNQVQRERLPKWQKSLWVGSGAGLALVILALFCFTMLVIFKTLSLFERFNSGDLGFMFAGVALVNLTLIRLLAVLIGAAIAFAGVAVSFFAHDRATNLSVEGSAKAQFSLATYSPGIVAIVVGAGIVIAALYARGHHSYTAAPTVSYQIRAPATPSFSGSEQKSEPPRLQSGSSKATAP
jgi:hypothetical protein